MRAHECFGIVVHGRLVVFYAASTPTAAPAVCSSTWRCCMLRAVHGCMQAVFSLQCSAVFCRVVLPRFPCSVLPCCAAVFCQPCAAVFCKPCSACLQLAVCRADALTMWRSNALLKNILTAPHSNAMNAAATATTAEAARPRAVSRRLSGALP